MAATPLLPPLLARRPPTRLPPFPTARRRLAATREWGSSPAVASAIWISWVDHYHEHVFGVACAARRWLAAFAW